MKKCICIFLTISILFLCSCSLPREIEETVNLNLDFLQDKTILNIDNNDRYILIQAVPFTSEEPMLDEAAEESNIDEIVENYFYIWDIERSRLKSQYSLEINVENDIASVEISDDNYISLISYDNSEESALYDLRFNRLSDIDKTVSSEYDKANELMKQSKIIDNERFSNYGNLATYTTYIDKQIYVFLSDYNTAYLKNIDNDFSPLICENKLILENNNCNDKGLLTYRICDYENMNIISTTIDYGSCVYPSQGSFSNKYAVITANDESGQNNIITVWNTASGTETPLNAEVISADSMEEKIEVKSNEICEKYNIEIETYKKYDENSLIDSYAYSNDLPKSELMVAMYDFEYCLSTLPTELYSEIISTKAIEFDKLKFYFVGNFDDEKNSQSVSAYCSNVNDELYIVYSITGFTYSTFCHELMHAMEYRIWDYEEYFDDNWIKLNPEGFEYVNFDDDSNPYYEKESWQNYFARDYGMNNEFEDRATVFETICESAHLKEEAPWWTDKKPFVKKAKYLVKVLRKAFPSLNDDSFNMFSNF